MDSESEYCHPELFHALNSNLLSEFDTELEKIVVHAAGNFSNDLFYWKSNPSLNSEFRFGFSASESADFELEK